MYQVPFEGRNTAMSGLPSPLKSPATGISPTVPQSVSGRPAISQRPALGRNTPTSLTPSWLKSLGTRRAVAAAACVTVNVNPAILIAPVRGEVVVFAPIVHVISVVPVPAPGDVTVMNRSRLTALQPHTDALVASVTEPDERVAGTEADASDSE
jgi:hypothetical protein